MRYLSLLLAAFATVSVSAEFSFEDLVTLRDIDPDSGNGMLGRAVAVNDGLVFMGAPEANSRDGAAYLFRIDAARNLGFVTEYFPQDPSPSRYGGNIVTDGEWTAIGYDTDNVIELFRRSGSDWTFHTAIEPPDLEGVAFQTIGEIFDLEGDTLVVGVPKADIDGVGNAGMVLIYRRDVSGADNWGLEAHIMEDVPVQANDFGQQVAVGTDTLVAVVDAGTERDARVYRRVSGNWQFLKTLQAQGRTDNDDFGFSAAMEGDVIAIGARVGNSATEPTNAGSVHLFGRNEGGADNFGQIVELTPSEPRSIDRFGESLRLRQGILVVGAPGGNQAFVFSRQAGPWEEIDALAPPMELTFNNVDFGQDVDYQDGSVVIGADRWDDTSSLDRYGAVFLFEDPAIVSCGVLDGIFCDGFEGEGV